MSELGLAPDRALANELSCWASAHEVPLILPSHPEYVLRRRVYNRIHDPHPQAILLPRTSQQVARTVTFLRSLGPAVAVRGGGHHVAGFGSCDGVVLDLGSMTNVELSADGHVASVEGGSRLRHVDAALTARGRVVPTGTVSDTGIGGLALGGGIGWLVGRYGLTCDQIIGADVVLSDGSTVRAEEEGAEDLLWALRGGGGGMGVVTRFRFAAQELLPCTVGSALVPMARSRDALIATFDFLLSSCPRTLTVAPLLRDAGDGQGLLSVDFCLTGRDEAPLSQLLRAIGPAQVNLQTDASFVRWQQNTDELFLQPLRGYWKAAYVRELTPNDIDSVLSAFEARPTATSAVLFEHLHGAFHEQSAASSAFPLRWARCGVLFSARWLDANLDDDCKHWARGGVLALDPRSSSGAYSNYSLADDTRVTRDIEHQQDIHSRLIRTKHRYDPTNFFCQNHLSRALSRTARRESKSRTHGVSVKT